MTPSPMCSGGADVKHVTVDLTPMLPGGANGGAKIVAQSLVREFATLAPATQFTLLTSATSHAECAHLEAPNVHRSYVDVGGATGSMAVLRAAVRGGLNTILPPSARTRVKNEMWRVLKRHRRRALAHAASAGTDLIFCPFTAPYFSDARVPLVTLVHDLQFLDLPQFFAGQMRTDRHENFLSACRLADRLICVSEFVRQSVLRHAGLDATRVQTIHSTTFRELRVPSDAANLARRVLDRLGIQSSRYHLYPANVWPHKNHALLVEALRVHLAAEPGSDLALLCTGTPSAASEELARLARARLPAGRFGFAGFLSDAEFMAVLHGCRGLIFPSLYEGFGMPVLEAMALRRPVLCSDIPSLVEIASDAALLFDPHDPAAIARAVQRLESTPALEAELIRRGRERVSAFGTPGDVAGHYLGAFEEVVSSRASAAATALTR